MQNWSLSREKSSQAAAAKTVQLKKDPKRDMVLDAIEANYSKTSLFSSVLRFSISVAFQRLCSGLGKSSFDILLPRLLSYIG